MDGTLVLAIGFWLAFFGSRLVRARGVPEIVGFLIVGAAIGPSGFGFVDQELLDSLKPVVAIATAVLMFGIGERLSGRQLKSQPFSAPAGALSAILTAAIVWPLASFAGATSAQAMLLAVLASAGAPMTISALAAKGRSPYSSGLIGAHAVSDAIAAVAFSVALPAAILMTSRVATFEDAAWSFLRLGLGSVALGALVGGLMVVLGRKSESVGEAMVMVLVHMVVLAIIANSLQASIPLSALVAGAIVATRLKEAKRTFIFKSVHRIEEPLFLLFFTIAGASIHLDLLTELGLLGAMYLLGRTIGKVLGGFAGGLIGKKKVKDAILLGVDMVPQAGSAVALVVIVTDQLPNSGASIAVVVLGAVVVFEAISPFFTAKNLRRHVPDSAEQSSRPPTHTQPDAPSVVVADYPPPPVVADSLDHSPD